MNRHFLFDMDGTLTQPRQPISEEMITLLEDLDDAGIEWGIISGSDEKLMREQLGENFDKWNIYACNGTQVFRNGKQTFNISMRNFLGEKEFTRLMKKLIQILANHLKTFEFERLTGNFIINRESMINFSFIGRGENDLKARKLFKEIDKKNHIREMVVKKLRAEFSDLDISIGGETSIDISPQCWGKEYVNNHLHNFDIIFFGDKLMEGGNDYSMIKVAKECIAVTGPEDTIKKIKKILK